MKRTLKAVSAAAMILITSVAGHLSTTTVAMAKAAPHTQVAVPARTQSHSITSHTPVQQPAPFSAQLAPSQAMTIFLPLLLRNFPLRTIFGIETTSLDNAGALPQIISAGATLVRRNALIWANVEPTPGARNWAAVAGLDQELQNAAQNNIQTVLIVRGTPTWAQAVPGSQCGPILPAQYGAFGAFLHDVAQRYGNRIAFLEIGNEPDAILNTSNDPYGCWGTHNDLVYFGGGAYGQMLTQIYPQIKAGNSSVQVLIGGLLLDCDPRNPPTGKDCLPSKFLEGILKAGAANSFDGVSFHAYDFSSLAEPLGTYSNSSWASAWNTTGPVVIAKARFIRQILAANGAFNKTLINTETALICYLCASKGATFEESKAYYVPQAFAAALAEGLYAQVWYSWQGWNNSDLDDPTYPKALTAYTVARQKLAEVTFIREVTGLAGVKAYEFQKGNHKLWVAWSLDGAAHVVTLPAVSLAIHDVYGLAQADSSAVTITLKPLYIELP